MFDWCCWGCCFWIFGGICKIRKMGGVLWWCFLKFWFRICGLEFLVGVQGGVDGVVVEIVEFIVDGYVLGKFGDVDICGGQCFGDVMCGGLVIDGG